MSENQKELKQEASKLDQQIHDLEKKKMDLTKKIIEEKVSKEDVQYQIGEIINDQIPSILTLSLRKILEFYGESILELKARGGTLPHDKTPLDEDYGLVFASGDSCVVEINYKQRRNPDGSIINPLNRVKIDEIFDHLDHNLPGFEVKDKDGNVENKFDPDIPVEYLVVEIKDDRLKKLAKTKTNIFEATFKSEKAETSKIRGDIHKRNRDLGVYYLGFEIRNLNLFQLIEQSRKLVEKRKLWKRISTIQWDGYAKQHLRPRSPIAIAQHIYENYLPPGYKSLKKYLITKENKLELDGYKVG
ncbi:MAG: hypothetical protein ACFFDF_21230 [Candidatus Odinarchaeota archaeon]